MRFIPFVGGHGITPHTVLNIENDRRIRRHIPRGTSACIYKPDVSVNVLAVALVNVAKNMGF
jgi:hypothetical protein